MWMCTPTLLAGGLVAGCGMQPSASDLTAEQVSAITAGVQAIRGLSDTTVAAGSSAASEDQQNGKTLVAQSITFGECPVITLDSAQDDQPAALTLDFGDGCTPDGATAVCTGSATGTIRFNPRELTLEYSGFGCGLRTVDGTAVYTWLRTGDTVRVNGDWDITIDPADELPVNMDGAGQARYDSGERATTIEDHSGVVTYDGRSWDIDLSGVQVSYRNNANLVGFAGTMAISGGPVGALDVTFDADSPTTGVVSVSINGGPQFDYTLVGF